MSPFVLSDTANHLCSDIVSHRFDVFIREVRLRIVCCFDDSVGVRAAAAGRAEDGEDKRHRHQSWHYPIRLRYRVDFAKEVAFRFHNFVFPLS